MNLKSDISAGQLQANIDLFRESLKGYAFVTDVLYQETTVNDLNEMLSNVGIVLVVFIALLLFVSVVLINNTIQIVIYAKRYTIKTMQLVGAKRGFIVRPFLSKSILYGFLGAVIAIVLLAVLVVVFNSRFNYIDINDTTTQMVLSAIAGVIVVFGIAISFISTYFSVRYYLNHKDEQLY